MYAPTFAYIIDLPKVKNVDNLVMEEIRASNKDSIILDTRKAAVITHCETRDLLFLGMNNKSISVYKHDYKLAGRIELDRDLFAMQYIEHHVHGGFLIVAQAGGRIQSFQIDTELDKNFRPSKYSFKKVYQFEKSGLGDIFDLKEVKPMPKNVVSGNWPMFLIASQGGIYYLIIMYGEVVLVG